MEQSRETTVLFAAVIGRDEGCQLVLEGANAARRHCTLERRKDKFVIADVRISFGDSRAAATEVVEFFCGPAPLKLKPD